MGNSEQLLLYEHNFLTIFLNLLQNMIEYPGFYISIIILSPLLHSLVPVDHRSLSVHMIQMQQILQYDSSSINLIICDSIQNGVHMNYNLGKIF